MVRKAETSTSNHTVNVYCQDYCVSFLFFFFFIQTIIPNLPTPSTGLPAYVPQCLVLEMPARKSSV